MSVNLQVVGIYYKYDIDTKSIPGSNYSVKQIMDAAQKQTNADKSTFAYAFAVTPGGNYVDFIAATYSDAVSSPVSHTSYVAGTYGLAQTFTSMNGNTYSVWQYYIFDQDDKVVAAGSSPETPFDQVTVVMDGYKIIWRLVSICGATRTSSSANLASNLAAPGMNARFAKLIGKPFNKA